MIILLSLQKQAHKILIIHSYPAYYHTLSNSAIYHLRLSSDTSPIQVLLRVRAIDRRWIVGNAYMVRPERRQNGAWKGRKCWNIFCYTLDSDCRFCAPCLRNQDFLDKLIQILLATLSLFHQADYILAFL